MGTPTLEEKYRQELLLSRTVLKNEMQKAIRAISPDQKRALVATWKEVFKPEVVRELLRVAKDKEARLRIADWNLEGFDKERRVKKI
jgi:DNA polymerase III alpha subunit